MRTNATSVANRFVEIANEDGRDMTLLGLVKRVYIAHGFHLAFLGTGLLDPRFDRAEAWRHGPVIPSVFHSFSHWRGNPITEGGVIGRYDEKADKVVYALPAFADRNALAVVDAVYLRYTYMTDEDMVKLTRLRNTPWALCYKEGESVAIPDAMTREYYTRLACAIKEEVRTNEERAGRGRGR